MLKLSVVRTQRFPLACELKSEQKSVQTNDNEGSSERNTKNVPAQSPLVSNVQQYTKYTNCMLYIYNNVVRNMFHFDFGQHVDGHKMSKQNDDNFS